MTDIIERLRNPTSLSCGTLHWKAADEIERLTRAVKQQTEMADLRSKENCELRQEIERLREALRRTTCS